MELPGVLSKPRTSGDSDLIGLGGVQALLYLKALQLIQIYIIARIELSYCYSRAGHLICPPPASSSPGPGQYEPLIPSPGLMVQAGLKLDISDHHLYQAS